MASFVPDFTGLFTSTSTAASATMFSPTALTTPVRNSTSLRVLLNVSHILSSVLDETAWTYILDCMRQMDNILHGKNENRMLAKKMSQATMEGPGGSNTDPSMLISGIQQLFDSTKWMTNSAFCNFARALTHVHIETCGVPNMELLSDAVTTSMDPQQAAMEEFLHQLEFKAGEGDLGSLSAEGDVRSPTTPRPPSDKLPRLSSPSTQTLVCVFERHLFHSLSSSSSS